MWNPVCQEAHAEPIGRRGGAGDTAPHTIVCIHTIARRTETPSGPRLGAGSRVRPAASRPIPNLCRARAHSPRRVWSRFAPEPGLKRQAGVPRDTRTLSPSGDGPVQGRHASKTNTPDGSRSPISKGRNAKGRNTRARAVITFLWAGVLRGETGTMRRGHVGSDNGHVVRNEPKLVTPLRRRAPEPIPSCVLASVTARVSRRSTTPLRSRTTGRMYCSDDCA